MAADRPVVNHVRARKTAGEEDHHRIPLPPCKGREHAGPHASPPPSRRAQHPSASQSDA